MFLFPGKVETSGSGVPDRVRAVLLRGIFQHELFMSFNVWRSSVMVSGFW